MLHVHLKLCAVYQIFQPLHRCHLPRYCCSSNDVISAPFLPRFRPLKIYYYSFWHVAFLYHWDIEMSTKTCSTILLVYWSCCHESPKIKLERMSYEALFATDASFNFKICAIVLVICFKEIDR
jgi:hypothetical protein